MSVPRHVVWNPICPLRRSWGLIILFNNIKISTDLYMIFLTGVNFDMDRCEVDNLKMHLKMDAPMDGDAPEFRDRRYKWLGNPTYLLATHLDFLKVPQRIFGDTKFEGVVQRWPRISQTVQLPAKAVVWRNTRDATKLKVKIFKTIENGRPPHRKRPFDNRRRVYWSLYACSSDFW